MKFIIALVTALAICAVAATAGEKKAGDKKAPLTAEQKEFQKKMLEKYDANKDGKLDKEERAKMSNEDKAEQKKLFPRADKPTKKKKE